MGSKEVKEIKNKKKGHDRLGLAVGASALGPLNAHFELVPCFGSGGSKWTFGGGYKLSSKT